MTTLMQLDMCANEWFNQKMRRRGFALEKKFYFWRKRGPLFDVFWSEILTGGSLLRVWATVLSPWVDSPDGEFVKFPVSVCVIGGPLSDNFPKDMIAGTLFDVSTKNEIDESFRKLLEIIDNSAIPWFNSIVSFDTYMAQLGLNGHLPTVAFRKKLKEGIARGFEIEPLCQAE
ncbi:MAG: hypothetical protein ACJ8GW_20545 [Massilia sp.]